MDFAKGGIGKRIVKKMARVIVEKVKLIKHIVYYGYGYGYGYGYRVLFIPTLTTYCLK